MGLRVRTRRLREQATIGTREGMMREATAGSRDWEISPGLDVIAPQWMCTCQGRNLPGLCGTVCRGCRTRCDMKPPGKGPRHVPEPLVIDVGVAKMEKYASRESGDTVELVERPSGGFTVVMIDGQGSGRAAKTLSLLLSSKAVALVKEGVRDSVVARATHDYLFAFRHGQVSATLDLLSIDLKTRSIVITRNAESPLLLGSAGQVSVNPPLSGPIGR